MNPNENLWDTEKNLWLKGVDYFAISLAPECLIALPKPVGILTKDDTLESLRRTPRWDSVEMINKKLFVLDSTAVLAYEAQGIKGDRSYRAICTSTYARVNNHWLMIQHQQTPTSE